MNALSYLNIKDEICTLILYKSYVAGNRKGLSDLVWYTLENSIKNKLSAFIKQRC